MHQRFRSRGAEVRGLKLPKHLRRRLRETEGEEGSAIIEFLLLGVLLLIPVVYLLIGIAALQAASYAAVGAADQAAKSYVQTVVEAGEGSWHSERSIATVLEDFGIDRNQAEVQVHCPSGSCDRDGDIVVFTVQIRVPVPLISQLGSWETTLATVSSRSAQMQSG